MWFSNWVEFATSHRIYFKYKHRNHDVKPFHFFLETSEENPLHLEMQSRSEKKVEM